MKKKVSFPPGFTGMNDKVCASCNFVEKALKTKTAYCAKYAITFPLYESTLFYVCDDHMPVKGDWAKDQSENIEEDKNA